MKTSENGRKWLSSARNRPENCMRPRNMTSTNWIWTQEAAKRARTAAQSLGGASEARLLRSLKREAHRKHREPAWIAKKNTFPCLKNKENVETIMKNGLVVDLRCTSVTVHETFDQVNLLIFHTAGPLNHPMWLEKQWKRKSAPPFVYGNGVENQSTGILMVFTWGCMLGSLPSMKQHLLLACFPRSCSVQGTWPTIWKRALQGVAATPSKLRASLQYPG